jgi:ABC transporter substrate binding protein
MGSTRRRFLLQMGGVLSAFPYRFDASQEHGLAVRRIGFINGDPSLTDPFTARLHTLGYTDANLFIDPRIVSGPEMRKHATELATGNLELVVAGALPFALEIRRANPAMRMVIATCPGMISNGFAKTLHRPGGNVTGIEELPPGLTAKRLTLLKTVVPYISRVALLSTTPGTGGHETQLADAEQIAPALNITVKAYRATSLAELQAALAAIASDGMNGLANFQGGLSLQYRQMIAASPHSTASRPSIRRPCSPKQAV